MPVEWSGRGNDATVPMNSGATTTSMGSGTPQAKIQTSELSKPDAMSPISQSVCPVGQAFAVASISPRANMMKMARKSLMRAAIKPGRECIMVPAQSGASAPSANHKLGSAASAVVSFGVQNRNGSVQDMGLTRSGFHPKCSKRCCRTHAIQCPFPRQRSNSMTWTLAHSTSALVTALAAQSPRLIHVLSEG